MAGVSDIVSASRIKFEVPVPEDRQDAFVTEANRLLPGRLLVREPGKFTLRSIPRGMAVVSLEQAYVLTDLDLAYVTLTEVVNIALKKAGVEKPWAGGYSRASSDV